MSVRLVPPLLAAGALLLSGCAETGLSDYAVNRNVMVQGALCADLSRDVAASTPGCEEFLTVEIADPDAGDAAVLDLDGPGGARAATPVLCGSIDPGRIAAYPACLVATAFMRDTGDRGGDSPGESRGGDTGGGGRSASTGTSNTGASASSGPGGDSAGGRAGSSSASASRSAGGETSASASTSRTSASVSDTEVSARAGNRSVSLRR